MVKNTILETISDNKGASPTLLFDTIKCRVRGYTVKYSSYKKRTNKLALQDWNEKLSTLQEALPHITDVTEAEHASDEIRLLTGRIEESLAEITKGSALRAKVQQYEEGERCSKFFYNSEKSNYNKKSLTRLITDHGEINNPSEILNEQVKYYTKLYSSQSNTHYKTLNT